MLDTSLPGAVRGLIWALLGVSSAAAMAGRPLATDDAGTADARTCQVETWIEKQHSEQDWVLSPACGVVDGVELGLEYVRPETRDEVKAAAGVALKWVPAAWKTTTAWGDLNVGLKWSAGYQKPVDTGWQPVDRGLLLLATLAPSERWVVHANLGAAHDRANKTTATVLNLASTFTPTDSWLVFAEVQANNKHAVFGKSVQSTGVRYWLVPDSLGLDVTASHQKGSPTGYTFGLGWYGLFK